MHSQFGEYFENDFWNAALWCWGLSTEKILLFLCKLCKMKTNKFLPDHLWTLSILVGLLTLSLFFSACSKDKTDQIDAPPAIKELIKNFNCEDPICTPTIREYVWRGDTVYVYLLSGALCDTTPPPVYNSDGQIVLKFDATYTFDAFLQESTFIRVVASCKR